ncbi:endonuclease III domain-containing protein [Deinococcus maricopensis]|uniref:Iron-sulfur cluster loop n=1 Tax=Deinococcus maricopensis (strain DSM 21211 / LMG 22137 / NRRL B-23946 / LB-34) TaxID=709986 RepID=E8U9P9_DEIML|nr:(Fe-S)-cluster assembly protein [Deinococcus maricopensis]ADV67788.1 iron-sulfur cluster loop [Deinococcus maricopensis DSM 21211]
MPRRSALPPRAPRPTLAQQHPPRPDLGVIAARLRERYLPTLPAPRVSAEPLDDLIEAVLNQQNTRATTERQYAALRRAYPTWDAALADGPDGIEAVLRDAGGGLARVKADYVWNILYALLERGDLSLQHLRHLDDADARTALESLPGVGMKTASALLLFDLARPAMPVDGHIDRVSKRLHLIPERWNVLKAERWYDEVLPRDWAQRYAYHVATIRHGRETCLTRAPRCNACVLRDLCPSEPLLNPDA